MVDRTASLRRVTIELDAETHKAFRRKVIEEDTTMQAILEGHILTYVKGGR